MNQPTDQNSKLHAALTGEYSRRCVEPCPNCDGDCETGYESCGPAGWISVICPTCSDSGVVFRDDEAGRDNIRLAVAKLGFSSDRYGYEHNIPGQAVMVRHSWKRIGEGNAHDFLWDNRQGQPWQNALEQHVRDYLAPCPDLRVDTEELKRLLLLNPHVAKITIDHYPSIMLGGKAEPGHVFAAVWRYSPFRNAGSARKATEGESLYAAALAALVGGE